MKVRQVMPLLATAAGLAACELPYVPRDPGSGVVAGERFQRVPGPVPERFVLPPPEPPLEERLGAPVEVRGLLVGNAVSSVVIEPEDGGWITMQITPQTQLRIGEQVAGLREIQPGSEVRATYVPTGVGSYDLALEIVADPENVGWRGRYQAAPPEIREGTEQQRR